MSHSYNLCAIKIQIVTCFEKRDHLGFEFLACIDSSMRAESNGASFMKKY